MTEPTSVIKLDNIHLELESDAGKVNILRGIDLDIPAGKTVSIAGPSGSGKTTLLMILSGLGKPTSVRVVLSGKELTGLSEDDLAAFRRDHVGIVFQNFHLIPTMNALENVAIPLELAGAKDAFKKAEAALAAVQTILPPDATLALSARRVEFSNGHELKVFAAALGLALKRNEVSQT